MIKIRLARGGRKAKPVFTIVASDAKSPRDGRFLARLGQYDPHKGTELTGLKTEELKNWIGKGAQLTDTVRSLLKRNNIQL